MFTVLNYQLFTIKANYNEFNSQKTAKKSENALLALYHATPIGVATQKLNEIAQKVEVETRTVRRWITEGRTPRKFQYNTIVEVLVNKILPPQNNNQLKTKNHANKKLTTRHFTH